MLDEQDALAYSSAGFIWDNALAHAKDHVRLRRVCWPTHKKWKDLRAGKASRTFWTAIKISPRLDDQIDYWCEAGLVRLQVRRHEQLGWDLDVPDVFRARRFIKKLKRFEADRTKCQISLSSGSPTITQAARGTARPRPRPKSRTTTWRSGELLEAVSHCQFWKDTCIFAIEDDPQAGWDHVSGYRTTAYVISPYTRRRQS